MRPRCGQPWRVGLPGSPASGGSAVVADGWVSPSEASPRSVRAVGNDKGLPTRADLDLVAVGRSCLNPVPASPIDGGRSTDLGHGAGRVITSVTRKLPSGSGRAVMAMPGVPTVRAMGRGGDVRGRDRSAFGAVRWVGRMVRAGEGLGWTRWVGAVPRSERRSRAHCAEGAAEPGQLSPAPTATAAPSRAVTVNAPTERRTVSRARDPGHVSPSPRRHHKKFVRHS